jgi:hypothetical protein
MNLQDIASSPSTKAQDEEDSDNEEVLPLDFRTAMIQEENKIVIQAKPLAFKTLEDDEKDM